MHNIPIYHDGGLVTLSIDAICREGAPLVMNPPSKAYPGDPPYVEEVLEVEIKADELDRDLDPRVVYEEHQESLDQAILRRESEREPSY